MDVTIFKTLDNIKNYIYLIQDNYSRTILGWKIVLECNAEIACRNLREVCEKYQLYNVNLQLITDDGSENNGAVKDFLRRDDVTIKKQVALKDITFSNSMVEAANKKIKYESLLRKNIPDHNHLVKYVDEFIPEYNDRPNGQLHGYTPNEVLCIVYVKTIVYRPNIRTSRLKPFIAKRSRLLSYQISIR